MTLARAILEGSNGAKFMELLKVIRNLRLRRGSPIRAMARHTVPGRNTIRKYLSADTIAPHVASPAHPSKLGPFAEKPAGWLKTEAGQSCLEQRTPKRPHSDLVVLGWTVLLQSGGFFSALVAG